VKILYWYLALRSAFGPQFARTVALLFLVFFGFVMFVLLFGGGADPIPR
jgi:hypothetical protein